MKTVTITCDVCKEDYTHKQLELQEFVHISYIGGYGSVFGDSDRIQLDICQYCLQDKLGEWIRVTDEA